MVKFNRFSIEKILKKKKKISYKIFKHERRESFLKFRSKTREIIFKNSINFQTKF